MSSSNTFSKTELKTARSKPNEVTPQEQILLAIDTPKNLGKKLSSDHPYRIGDVVWVTSAVKSYSARAIVVGTKANGWLKLRNCNSKLRGQAFDLCCHYTTVIYNHDLQLGYSKEKPKFLYSPRVEKLHHLQEVLDESLQINRALVSENQRLAAHLALMRTLNKNFEHPTVAAAAEAIIEATRQKAASTTNCDTNTKEQTPTSPKTA